MAKSPIHVAIALLLTAVYAIVGGTGTSLHYLLGEMTSADRSTAHKSKHRHGYMHCHGPDYHWHYHSWEEVDEEQAEVDQTEPQDGSASCHAQRYPHQPHACPALAVVATLKLGAGRVEVLPAANQARCFLTRFGELLKLRQVQPPHLPRGPPWPVLA